jgi:hypothetical protein
MEIYAEKTFSPVFIKLETLEEANDFLKFLNLSYSTHDDPDIINDILENLRDLVKPYKNYPDKIKTKKK